MKIPEYAPIKVGKNQVYREGKDFVVERYEYTYKGVDYFSVFDTYSDFDKAVRIATTLRPEQ